MQIQAENNVAQPTERFQLNIIKHDKPFLILLVMILLINVKKSRHFKSFWRISLR